MYDQNQMGNQMSEAFEKVMILYERNFSKWIKLVYRSNHYKRKKNQPSIELQSRMNEFTILFQWLIDIELHFIYKIKAGKCSIKFMNNFKMMTHSTVFSIINNFLHENNFQRTLNA